MPKQQHAASGALIRDLPLQGLLRGYDQATNLILDECHERVFSVKVHAQACRLDCCTHSPQHHHLFIWLFCSKEWSAWHLGCMSFVGTTCEQLLARAGAALVKRAKHCCLPILI